MQDSSDQICIRLATSADIPQLCHLLSLLFEQEEDFLPDLENQARGLRLIIKQPEVGMVFCAVDGTSVVGMVSILFTVSTAEGGRVAWLEDMVVHPSRRGQGIGERLINEAKSSALAAGCSRITLLTDATNNQALKFYRKAGFLQSQMVPLRLKISENHRRSPKT